MYTTDRSMAVVPMLFLFCVALWFALWGTLCLVLPCSLSVCFFCPFGGLVALLGEWGGGLGGGAGLCAYGAFVCWR